MSQQHPQADIPFWNVNIPADQWTIECPPYLAACDEFDRKQLGIPDQDYPRMSWSEVKDVISKQHTHPSFLIFRNQNTKMQKNVSILKCFLSLMMML